MTPDPATLATAINAVTDLRDKCTDAQGREWEALDAALDALQAIARREVRPVSDRQRHELSQHLGCLMSATASHERGDDGSALHLAETYKLAYQWIIQRMCPAQAEVAGEMRRVG